MPALLTSTLAPPNSFFTRWPPRRARRGRSRRPYGHAPSPSSAARASIRSSRRARSATWYPSAWRARAVAAPIPDEAPVMTATRGNFWESDILITFPFSGGFSSGKTHPWLGFHGREDRSAAGLDGTRGFFAFLPRWPQIHAINLTGRLPLGRGVG